LIALSLFGISKPCLSWSREVLGQISNPNGDDGHGQFIFCMVLIELLESIFLVSSARALLLIVIFIVVATPAAFRAVSTATAFGISMLANISALLDNVER
jgi:hypothetical protein